MALNDIIKKMDFGSISLGRDIFMMYQNVLKKILIVIGVISGVYYIGKHKSKQIYCKDWQIDKYIDHFQLLNHWLEVKNEGKSVAVYFEEMGYKHIAIYGMAELGNRLCEDLANSSIYIDYGIDRDVCCCIARIAEVYSPEDELPEVDAIVVTPYSVFEEIKNDLEKRIKCPIISLESVVWSV